MLQKLDTKVVDKVQQRINQLKLLPIAREELSRIFRSWKFKFVVLIMMLPVIILLLGAGEIQPADFGVDATVYAFELNAGANILEFWAALPAQFLVVMIAAELIAGEVENSTLTLLLTKPIRRADILFGKLLAFLICLVCITVIPLTAFAGLITLIYRGGRDGFFEILWGPFALGESVMILGLLTIGCFAIMLSSVTRKSLYGALSALLFLFLFNLFVPNFSFLGPSYTLEYRLGLILEEGYRLVAETKFYTGDPILTFAILVWLNILFLVIALIALFRREMP